MPPAARLSPYGPLRVFPLVFLTAITVGRMWAADTTPLEDCDPLWLGDHRWTRPGEVNSLLSIPGEEAVIVVSGRHASHGGHRALNRIARCPWAEDEPVVHLLGMEGQPDSAALSADGRWLLCAASGSEGVVFFNRDNGRQVASFARHGWAYEGLAISPDGRRAVAGSQGEAGLLLDTRSGEALVSLETIVREAVVLGEGLVAVNGGRRGLTIFDWEGERRLRVPFDPKARFGGEHAHLASSASGNLLAIGGPDNRVALLDVDLQEVAVEQQWLWRAEEPNNFTKAVAVRSDGTAVAAVSYDGSIRVFAADSGEVLHHLRLPVRGDIWNVAVAWCGAEERLMVSALGHLYRVDLQGGNVLPASTGHGFDLLGLALSPDGTRLASIGRDRRLQVWSVSDGSRLASHLLEENPDDVAWTDKDHCLVIGGGAQAKVIQVESGETSLLLPDREYAIPSERSVVVDQRAQKAWITYADSLVREWDLQKGVMTGSWTMSGGMLHMLAVSGDAALVAGGSPSRSDERPWRLEIRNRIDEEVLVRLEELPSREGDDQLQFVPQAGTWFPDDRRLLIGGMVYAAGVVHIDGQMVAAPTYAMILDGRSGEVLQHLYGHADEVVAVATWGKDQSITASEDGTVRLWDEAGQVAKIIDCGPFRPRSLAVVEAPAPFLFIGLDDSRLCRLPLADLRAE